MYIEYSNHKLQAKFNDMSVKSSFDTHLIPGLLRSSRNPPNIRNPLITT